MHDERAFPDEVLVWWSKKRRAKATHDRCVEPKSMVLYELGWCCWVVHRIGKIEGEVILLIRYIL